MMNRIPFLAPMNRWKRRQRRSDSSTLSARIQAEPEEAVAAIEPPKEISFSCTTDQGERDSKVQAIVALRNLVMKQGAELSSIQAKEKQYKHQINQLTIAIQNQKQNDDTSACSSVRRKRLVSFGPTFERSDELCSITSSGESTKEIDQAISSIQKQASQVETAMALDELQSVKSENEILKQQLQTMRSDLRRVRLELEECQQDVPTLVLEKELAQAEALKCREDLQACLKLFSDYDARQEQEDPKILIAQSSGRRFFGPNNSSKPRPSKPIQVDEEVDFVRAPHKKMTDTTSSMLLCLACKIQQQQQHTMNEDSTMRTPIQSFSKSTLFVNASPRDDYIHEQRQKSCRTRQCRVAMGELERQLDKLQDQRTQTEAAMIREMNRLKRDIEDARQNHHEQLQLKDFEIHKLQQELSNAMQQRENLTHF